MRLNYTKKLSLLIHKTDVEAQKIDGLSLKTFGMVIVGFQVQDKLGQSCFFQETFLLAKTSMIVVLDMPFLTLSNVEVEFLEEKLM